MGKEEMGIGILGGRQGTPRWANDPVWLHNGSRQNSGQVQVQAPPPEGNQGEGREGQRRAERVKKNGVAT